MQKCDSALSGRTLDRSRLTATQLQGLLLPLALPHDGVLALKSYFRNLDQRLEHGLEALFGNTPFLDAIASTRLHNLLPKARSSNLPTAMAEVIKQPSLFKTLDVLAKDFKGLRGMVGSLEEVIEGDVPLGEVYELAASFRGSVEGFVATVGEALQRARAGHAGEQTNGVNLLTYFKAKGLQWHTVMLTSCNQRIIPHKRAKVDDERRLFYVALTLAGKFGALPSSCPARMATGQRESL
jgi:DNA helicase-2/ATP-dependent DNA helicase PcrA